MTLAETILSEVRTLSKAHALEELDVVRLLKSRPQVDRLLERQAALAELAHYRGRFKAEKLSRDDLYDRARIGLTPKP